MRATLALAVLAAGCSPARALDGPNFLIVSMDTFRADRISAPDASGRSLTPSLDAFAQTARSYTWASSHSNETLFSHAALFTGRYPSDYGDLDYRSWRLPPDAETFAALLSRAGWRTEAVVAGGHLSPGLGLNVGFQRYQSMTDFGSFQQTVPAALERLEALAGSERPFLLFVHGYDTHSPYVKPGPLFRPDAPGYQGPMVEAARNPLTYERILGDRYYEGFNPPQMTGDGGQFFLDPAMFDGLAAFAQRLPGQQLSPDDIAFLRGTYDAAVRYADFHVGVLLEEVERLGLSEETVVVVLSDHGEDLLDHGYFNHRLSLHDENVRVPLMIRGPGIEPGRIGDPVGLVDVLPTLAGLAGLSAGGPGVDLRSAGDPGRAVYAESLRGDVSMASAAGRLSLPRSLAGQPLPEAAPAGAWLTGPDGAPLDWGDPVGEALAEALRAQVNR